MCDFILADSVPVDEVMVTVHPQMVRLDLTLAHEDGTLSVAHVELDPITAMRVAYQINEAHVVALQIPAKEAS